MAEGEVVRSVSCAKHVTFLLLVNGTALSCGEAEFGLLGHAPPPPKERGGGGGGGRGGGDDDDDDDEWEEEIECVSELQLVVVPRNAQGMLVQLCTASQHAAALTSDGRVITWGNADGGRLGRKPKVGARGSSPSERTRALSARAASDAHARPSAVKFAIPDQNIVSVSAGGAHTLAVSAGGQLWLWGQISANLSYAVPRLVLGPKLGHAFFLRAHAGDWMTLAIAVPPSQDFDDEGED